MAKTYSSLLKDCPQGSSGTKQEGRFGFGPAKKPAEDPAKNGAKNGRHSLLGRALAPARLNPESRVMLTQNDIIPYIF